MNLAGQVAVISGGLGAIGSATVRALAHHGADVACCDVYPAEQAANLLQEVATTGRRGIYQQVNIADPIAVSHWLSEVERSLGTATLIVPNAAVVDASDWFELNAESWRRLMAVNLDGVFYMAHTATLALVNRRLSGRVVFVGSWAAEHVHLEIPSYCIAKAGLRMLARCMAGALATHDILVNEISPGFVAAGLADKIPTSELDPHEVSRRQVPTGRIITPDEVAAQIVYLCDPENRHMTGSVLLMDGGLSLFGTATMMPRR